MSRDDVEGVSSARSSSSVATTLDQIFPRRIRAPRPERLQEKLAVRNDGHAGTELAHIVDDVGGENDRHIGADGVSRLRNRLRSAG